MEDLRKAFGRRLSALRLDACLTQERLAELAETSRDTIRNIEKGRHMPRFQLFARLAHVLQAHPRDFFDFDWPPANVQHRTSTAPVPVTLRRR